MFCGGRFRYPERAVIAISFCHNIVSVGYIARLLAGRESIACAAVDTFDGPRSILVDAALEHADRCTVVFLLVYYFSASGCVWWVLLALLWYLAYGMLWTREEMERHAWIFHVVAWTLPAVQTVAVLVSRSVVVDQLTGTCDVGGSSPRRLLLVIAPLAVFLITVIAFLAAGFVSLCRRRDVSRRATETGRCCEALTVRIGVFCVLYVVAGTVTLVCYFYEHVVTGSSSSDGGVHLSSAVVALRLTCPLVVGIASGFWIWNRRTIHSWKAVFERVCCRRPGCGSGSSTVVTSSALPSKSSPVGHRRPPALRRHQHYHRHRHHRHHRLHYCHHHHPAV